MGLRWRRPASAYQTGSLTGELRYATRSPAGSWEIITIDTGLAWESHDLAVDDSGNAHVAYTLQNSLMYTTRESDGTWSTRGFLEGCHAVDLAVNPAGNPHIVCSSFAGLDILSERGDGAWMTETVTDGSNLVPPREPSEAARSPDIVIDSTGQLHIVFRTSQDSLEPNDPAQAAKPYYATKTEGRWITEAIDPDGSDNGKSPKIGLDRHELPHVAYILDWRFNGEACHKLYNPCSELRYATPATRLR